MQIEKKSSLAVFQNCRTTIIAINDFSVHTFSSHMTPCNISKKAKMDISDFLFFSGFLEKPKNATSGFLIPYWSKLH